MGRLAKRAELNEKDYIKEKLKFVRERFSEEKKLDDTYAMEIIRSIVLDDRCAGNYSLDQLRGIIKKIFYKTRSRLGVLQPFAEDNEITEIMVNGPEEIFVEKKGRIFRTDITFDDVEELEDIMRNIAADVHREISEMNPILDARLADGSRVSAVYKNIAVNGPILTIRKFLDNYMRMEELVANETITAKGSMLLQTLVAAGYNIFVSGGTSSGKTTLLNALAEAIPKEERVIVIEDSMELKLPYIDNIVHMECRRGNASGHGRVSMSELIKASLRMRPDRVIVGEVRGGEVVEMIQAMNTGHDGSLSTGHGNSAEGMLRRLEAMYLMAAPQNVDAIRGQIAEGIDILVHIEKIEERGRRVCEITELAGYENGNFRLVPIMKLNRKEKLKITGNKLVNSKKLYLKGDCYADRLRQLGII